VYHPCPPFHTHTPGKTHSLTHTHFLSLSLSGHNLSQLVLGSLLDKGLAWALDEPLSRAAFPLVCLGPFLSKLSPSEAERVAGALSQQLEGAGLQEEDEEAALNLEAFLGHLQVGFRGGSMWTGFRGFGLWVVFKWAVGCGWLSRVG